MNTFHWLFIAGLGFILCGFCFIKFITEIEKDDVNSFYKPYTPGLTHTMFFFHTGFWYSTYSLSEILHQWWHNRATYLMVMLYAVFVYFAYQFIIKKFKVNDKATYSISKGISYIYLIVALYQFYRFLSF